jgi:hypothetical protein
MGGTEVSSAEIQFDEVLRSWAGFFEKERIRYALIGGLAMQAWGRSRFTNDADIAVERTARDRILAEAESKGYETLHVSEGYSNHLHADEELGRIDFMYVHGTTAEKIFDAATVKPVANDVAVAVASPEHLAMMKVIAMKNNPPRAAYEAEDVRLLINLPGVDTETVRNYFEQHGMLEMWHAIKRAR